mmetsp:Transcript_8319/g.13910  ORF Transcript_8319/g.13910 Transcript_8319/m.13910 type:complete len:82 (-) Transcript_8319:283-528(-)
MGDAVEEMKGREYAEMALLNYQDKFKIFRDRASSSLQGLQMTYSSSAYSSKGDLELMRRNMNVDITEDAELNASSSPSKLT